MKYHQHNQSDRSRLEKCGHSGAWVRAWRIASRGGFTLVEMLVAVGLVVLMMTLFASIFQMTTGTMATQKGLSENDQRVRMVSTLLRGDLKWRTMKEVAPFAAGEDFTADNWDNRRGYFYISENDPDDGTDDVLQFTTKVDAGDDPYVGAARLVLPDAAGFYGPAPRPTVSAPPAGSALPSALGQGNYWPNQPEFDDQLIGIPNYVSQSHMAEVAYFVRNGTLYRRVVLIREPGVKGVNQVGLPTDWTQAAPTNNALNFGIYTTPPATAVRNFYTDFDFSAYPDATSIGFHGFPNVTTAGTEFTTGGSPHLSVPQYRFGHDPFTGIPREHVNQVWDPASNSAVAGFRFIGRFTHEETSFISPNSTSPYDLFGYPGLVLGPGTRIPNPYQWNWAAGDPNNTNLTYDPDTGKVREYQGGTRISEDVLLANVKRFDIKVYDETAASTGAAGGWGPDGAPGVLGVNDDFETGDTAIDNPEEAGWEGSDDGAFADLGHTGNGVYSAGSLLNTAYCPAHPSGTTKPNNRLYRYDTWNPRIPGLAPFRPIRNGTVRMPLRAIQIKITFLDPTSQQLRDITIVQSLNVPSP